VRLADNEVSMTKRLFPFLVLLCGILMPLASGASEWPSPLEATDPAAEVPDIQFNGEAGQIINLSSLRGKVVILNIWATWCGPCVKEMPALDGLATYAEALGLAIIPLSVDRGGAAQVRDFYSRTGIKNLAVYTDMNKDVARHLRPRGLPLTLILDRQGREVARVYGPVEWTSEPVLNALRQAAGF